jgi:tetratricopeptide (TPR) repeat protein
MISAERWKQLRWEDFEALCYDYFCCCYPDTEIDRTPLSHDGGKDIVLYIKHPALSSRIWVECKKHSRPIGLEELGKNVVVIANRNIQKLIVVSANRVRRSAKLEMMQFAERHNFRIKFLDAERLEHQLIRYPAVVRRFFPGLHVDAAEPLEQALLVSTLVSEFETDSSDEQPTLKLRRDNRFYIHVFVENFAQSGRDVRLAFEATNAVLIRPRWSAMPEVTVSLGALEDRLVTFYCEALGSASTVELPNLVVTTKDEQGVSSETRHSLDTLQVTFLRTAPLKGEENHRFLGGRLPELLADVLEGRGRVIDLRGASGVGKTRMLREISVRLRRKGFEILEFDAREWNDFRLFRRLLADLLGLPLYRGFVRYSAENLRELFNNEGLDPAYAEKLHPFFVTDNLEPDTAFYVAEALRYFLVRRASTVPVAIQVDNFQEMSPAIVPLWDELLSFVRSTRMRACLLLSTNVETLSPVRAESISRFLDRLDEIRYQSSDFIHVLHVREFTEREARAFLMDMLPDVNQHDRLLDTLVHVAGQRPLYLEIFLHYMEDSGVVHFSPGGTWYIASVEALEGFLRTVPPGIAAALNRRLQFLREEAGEEWGDVRTALAALLVFEGRLPLDFLPAANVSERTVDLLVRKAFARFDRNENSVRFYHDVLERHFGALAELAPSRELSKRVTGWIEGLTEEARPAGSSKILFRAYCRLGLRERAVDAGADALIHAYGLQNHPDVVVVGDVLLDLMEDETGAGDLPRYLELSMRYAASLVDHVHFKRGFETFEKIRAYVRTPAPGISEHFRHDFYHQAVNARFLHLRLREALDLLREHQEMNGQEPWWQFLIEDRFGVVYTALGDRATATHHMDAALALAHAADNPLWRSIAASDYGYLHFYLTGDPAAAVEWFTQAVTEHRDVANPPLYRKVEAVQQAGYIDFLQRRWPDVLDRADQALWTCRRAHYTLLRLRVLNLKAAALLQLGRDTEAEDLLHEGRSEAELFFNERGRWRILSNLGALYAARGDLPRARTYLDAGVDAVRRMEVPPEGVVKELPLLANAALLRHLLGDALGVDALLAVYPDQRLKRYIQQMRGALRPGELTRAREMDGIALASYRGFSLFIS